MKTLALLLLLAVAPVHAALDVGAVIEGGALVVTVEGIDFEKNRPSLQLAVSEGVVLVESETPREHVMDRFTNFPWGRLVTESRTVVPLRGEGTVSINLSVFVGDAFERRRLEIAVREGAVAEVVAPTRSNWGPAGPGLHIGDTAPDFAVPGGDGTTLALADLRASKRPLFLMTYRSDW